jgi:hypothetical protein
MQIGAREGRSLGLGDVNGDGFLDFVLGTEDASPTTVWFGLNPKDLNSDGVIDARDLDDLTRNIGGDPREYDLNYDGRVTQEDVAFYLRKVLGVTAGDANLDGRVDLDDFGVLKANFAMPNRGWRDGDFNGNTVPDLDDFGILKANFGKGMAGGAAAVPEPAGGHLALGALAGVALARWLAQGRIRSAGCRGLLP